MNLIIFHRISGYPTLKLFYKGEVYDYSGYGSPRILTALTDFARGDFAKPSHGGSHKVPPHPSQNTPSDA